MLQALAVSSQLMNIRDQSIITIVASSTGLCGLQLNHNLPT
jgi:hypothetical protein